MILNFKKTLLTKITITYNYRVVCRVFIHVCRFCRCDGVIESSGVQSVGFLGRNKFFYLQSINQF